MTIAMQEGQQRWFFPDAGERISTMIRGLRRLAFADRAKEEKVKAVLRTGGQMQPPAVPIRKSGSREEAVTVVKEEKKKNK